jgi:hypothetical protein
LGCGNKVVENGATRLREDALEKFNAAVRGSSAMSLAIDRSKPSSLPTRPTLYKQIRLVHRAAHPVRRMAARSIAFRSEHD